MDERSERIERRLDLLVLIAALLVIPVIVIEESSFGEPWDTLGVVLNWATWLAFLAEAVVMLAVVPDRWRWIREHPIDVAIVVLTPPFLTALAPVRLLRLLRLLRLVRLAPLARRLFSLEGLRYTALVAALTAVAGGAGFAALEKGQSTAEGIYWAVTTMTTVGYGDLSPATTGGKMLAVVVMLVGIGFVAILTGAVAQRFVAPEIEAEAAEVEEDLDAASAALLDELREMRNGLGDMHARLADLEAALRHGRAP
jgi:voltage-gated potassium channel